MRSTISAGNIFLFAMFLAVGCGSEEGATGPQGEQGDSGRAALMVSKDEPKGAHCENGGIQIESGVDLNSDGILSADEVTATKYVCHGDAGAEGQAALIKTSVEPKGGRCPAGGIKVEVGIDANGNGVLDAAEINSTSTQYLCHGTSAEIPESGGTLVFSKSSLATEETGTSDFVGVKLSKRPSADVFVPVMNNNPTEGFVTPPQLMFTPANWSKEQKVTVTGVDDKRLDGDVYYNVTFGPATSQDAFFHGMVASVTVINSDNEIPADSILELIEIPAGTFASQPMARFKMAKTPTTVAQFKKCVDAGECHSEGYVVFVNGEYHKKHCNYGRGTEWLNHPMNCVSYFGAQEFCEWVVGGRLPTLNEWKYASTHNGTQALETTYPWGDTEPEHCVNGNYWVISADRVENHCDGKIVTTERVGTSEVGTYSPEGDSPLGLQDIFGNVTEWVSIPRSSSSLARCGSSWYSSSNSHQSHVYIENVYMMAGDITDARNGFRCVVDY